MSKPGRIIVGVDPHATSMAAMELAMRLAAGLDAELELFTPVYNSQVSLAHFPDREHLAHARESLVRRHREHLEASVATLGGGSRVACEASWDHPFEEALIRRVLERAADLLVVALPAGTGAGGRTLTSAHWQLVRHCPSPVLLTRGRAWHAAPVVVAAIDPMGRHGRDDELDTGILQAADRIAGATGGTVHAFHAWERTLLALVGDREERLAPDLPESGTESRHREAVYAALGAAEVAPARVSLVEGRPEKALPDYCRETAANLVVMGAIARNPFGRIFIGSTAERVLEQLPCDLMVVKPEAFRTPVSVERWPAEDAITPILGVPGI